MMNNRQTAALRQCIEKEERSRQEWEETHGKVLKYLQNGEDGAKQQENKDQSASVYNDAIRISSPRLVDDNGAYVPPIIRKKVVRQVEVPFKQLVRVPIYTSFVGDQQSSPTGKENVSVEEQSAYRVINEKYTEYIEKPAIRQKEIWVKKTVPERYMSKVPVERTRQVKVPVTIIDAKDGKKQVSIIPSAAGLTPNAYRVDEIHGSKLVEVEEYQDFQLYPVASGPAVVASQRDVTAPSATVPTSGKRIPGRQILPVDDPRAAILPEDNSIDAATAVICLPDGSALSSGKKQALANEKSRGGVVDKAFGKSSFSASGKQIMNNKFEKPKGVPCQLSKTQVFTQAPLPPPPPPRKMRSMEDFGVQVINREGTVVKGVKVTKVEKMTPADKAGLLVGDIITHFQNRPARNVEEYKAAVECTSGTVLVNVVRGAFKLKFEILPVRIH